MAEKTEIAWTDSTFNPWWGCSKVGSGCDHCYAEALDRRTGGDHWGPDKTPRVMSGDNWRKPVRWQRISEASGTRRRLARGYFRTAQAVVQSVTTCHQLSAASFPAASLRRLRADQPFPPGL